MRKKKPPKKKTKQAPLIPPLSMDALHDVEQVERAVRQALGYCCDSVSLTINVEKADRILKTCAVRVLDIQLAYYESLPSFNKEWILELQRNSIEGVLGLFPRFFVKTGADYFRDDLWTTTYNHLNPKKISKPSPQILPKPETLANQIDRLRGECRMTVDELAAALDLNSRSVYRHLSGKALPRKRQVAAYEKLFSKRLEKPVHLETSV